MPWHRKTRASIAAIPSLAIRSNEGPATPACVISRCSDGRPSSSEVAKVAQTPLDNLALFVGIVVLRRFIGLGSRCASGTVAGCQRSVRFNELGPVQLAQYAAVHP